MNQASLPSRCISESPQQVQPRDIDTQQKGLAFLAREEKEGTAAWQSTEEGACGFVILVFILCAKCAVNEILLPISLLVLCPKAHSAPLPSALTCLRAPTHPHSSPNW